MFWVILTALFHQQLEFAATPFEIHILTFTAIEESTFGPTTDFLLSIKSFMKGYSLHR